MFLAITIACGGGGGGGGSLFSDDINSTNGTNGGGSSGSSSGSSNGSSSGSSGGGSGSNGSGSIIGWGGGIDTEEDEEETILIGQIPELDVTSIKLIIYVNGQPYEINNITSTTTVAVLPKTKVGDAVSGDVYITLASEEVRATTIVPFTAGLDNPLVFKIPYKYTIADSRLPASITGTYYASEGINLEGYTDIGVDYWTYTTSSGETIVNTGTYISDVRGDITITPVLKDEYTVTFYSYSGDNTDEKVYSGYCVEEPETQTREGYQFRGWFTDDEYSEEFDFEEPITEDITLYPKWVIPLSGGGSDKEFSNKDIGTEPIYIEMNGYKCTSGPSNSTITLKNDTGKTMYVYLDIIGENWSIAGNHGGLKLTGTGGVIYVILCSSSSGSLKLGFQSPGASVIQVEGVTTSFSVKSGSTISNMTINTGTYGNFDSFIDNAKSTNTPGAYASFSISAN